MMLDIALIKDALKRKGFIRRIAKVGMPLYFRVIDSRYRKTSDSQWIANSKDSHRGDRCYIVGNGPSLSLDDLALIQGDYSFAFNGIDALFGKTDWRPTFLMISDRNYISRNANRLNSIDAPLILIDRCAKRRMKTKQANVVFTNLHMSKFTVSKFSTEGISFSNNPERCIYGGYTVTYAAMQLAMHMGFSEIILLGVDHTYSREITSDNKIVLRNHEDDHCFEDSSPAKGYFYYEGVEAAYRLADEEAKIRGVSILNATRGGSLELFQRCRLEDLVQV